MWVTSWWKTSRWRRTAQKCRLTNNEIHSWLFSLQIFICSPSINLTLSTFLTFQNVAFHYHRYHLFMLGCGLTLSGNAVVPSGDGIWQLSEALNTSKGFHLIEGLSPGTVYTVRLQASHRVDVPSIFEEVFKTRKGEKLENLAWRTALEVSLTEYSMW